MDEQIKSDVESYYTSKILKHGPTPQGVDWNSTESQILRFRQLAKVIQPGDCEYTLLDYGCGYGEFLETLRTFTDAVNYTGFDLSDAMLKAAQDKFGSSERICWTSDLPKAAKFDYVIASGIFNVKMSHSNENWSIYVTSILKEFHQRARKGFAFNVLTTYSDAELMREHLFYADPSWLFDYCKIYFSSQVAILHDYPLYEFTVLVRYGDGARK